MKKLNVIFTAAILFALSFSFPAIANWDSISSEEYEMDDPPAKGSAAYKRDFEILLKHQNSDREEACELAKSQVYGTYEEFFFTSTLLSRKEYDRAEDLVTRAMKYTVKISGEFKGEYSRPRPYNADSRIKPCARKPGGSRSYPSSHAAAGVVGACVLSAIYPDIASEMKDYGKYVGDLRFIVGVHHPSDVKAGQDLGSAICNRLLKNSSFKKELAELK